MILYKLLKYKLPFDSEDDCLNFVNQETPAEVLFEEIDDLEINDNVKELLKVNPD